MNVQSILWAMGDALCRLWSMLRTVVIVLAAAEPYVLGAFVIAGYGLLMFAGVSALVAMIPPTFWLGLVIIAAFGYLTYPKTKVVRNG